MIIGEEVQGWVGVWFELRGVGRKGRQGLGCVGRQVGGGGGGGGERVGLIAVRII